MSAFNLQGATALVTGASRGIGSAIARRLAAAGAHVVVHYGASSSQAESLIEQIERTGGRATMLQADLADVTAIERLARDRLQHFPQGLDILIHNAGVAVRKPFDEITPTDLDHMYALNVRAPFVLTQRLLPALNRGARVVLLSSIAARLHTPGLSAYALTKSAVDSLSIYLAAELGEREVRVNALACGVIDTEMSTWVRDPANHSLLMSRQALKRVGTVDDIASAVELLVSPAAGWITGAIVPVSGGTRL